MTTSLQRNHVLGHARTVILHGCREWQEAQQEITATCVELTNTSLKLKNSMAMTEWGVLAAFEGYRDALSFSLSSSLSRSLLQLERALQRLTGIATRMTRVTYSAGLEARSVDLTTPTASVTSDKGREREVSIEHETRETLWHHCMAIVTAYQQELVVKNECLSMYRQQAGDMEREVSVAVMSALVSNSLVESDSVKESLAIIALT